jgi:hypothetical protein
MSFKGAPVMAATVVAVDVGKNKAALSMTSADRHRLFGPVDFAMTTPALAAVLARVCVLCCRPDRSRLGWKQPGTITDRCWDRGFGQPVGRLWS